MSLDRFADLWFTVQSVFSPFTWRDAVDILVTGAMVWVVLAWFRRTRAYLALLGLALLGGVYLVAEQTGLYLTARIFQGFAAVSVVLAVVIFQEDVRRFLERVGIWSLRRRRAGGGFDKDTEIVRAVTRLAEERVGALLVFPGRELLDRHLEGGTPLGGIVTEALLLTLFCPETVAHDGAVVIDGSRVTRFSVHLPLSADRAQLGEGGTRHAAALGLAERSDALSVVVSEERGTISVARDGRLIRLERGGELADELRAYRARVGLLPSQRRGVFPALRRHSTTAIAALAISLGLWLLYVPGAVVVEVTRSIPVTVENVPAGYEVTEVSPEEVEATLSGPRRQLLLAGPGRVHAQLDGLQLPFGRRSFSLRPDSVEHPPNIRVLDVAPVSVRVKVRKSSEISEAKGGEPLKGR